MTASTVEMPKEAQPQWDFAKLMEAASTVAEGLVDRADEIEAARRLPLDIVDQLKHGGAFSLTVPKDRGGPELTSVEQFLVIERYARANASVAWCVMIGCDAGLYQARLEPEVAKRLYPRLDMVSAGWVYPVGRAERVAGGYRVSGRWMFGSGCQHSDVLAAGCIVHENGVPVLEDGQPMWRIMLAPREDYEILDTWHTTGLKGTGSTDYTCTDLFVPAEHSFNLIGPARHPGVLYAGHEALLRKMSAIPIGAARAALDQAELILQDKIERPSGIPYKTIPRVQAAVAEAEIKWGSARSYVIDSIGTFWSALEEGRQPTPAERSHLWLSRTNAFQSARDVARILFDTIGGSAIYRGPFDRFLRDSETMCQHLVGQQKGYELVGQLLLAPDGPAGYPMI